MGVSNPRFIAETAVGLDWQASEGENVPSAPYTPAQFIVAKVAAMNPDPKYIHPNGTHGAIWKRKDDDRITSQAFKVNLKLWGSRFQALPFLESVMSGQPTVAFGDLTVGSGSSISAISLIGYRPYHNAPAYDSIAAAAPILYATLTPAGGPAFPVAVTIYKDSARTQLVAHCSVAGAATPTTLIEDGSSGLTGSITLSAAAAQTPTVTVNKVTMAFATQFARYFRLFYTDGDESILLSDCVVEDMTFESSESSELAMDIKIMAKRRTVTASTHFAVSESKLDLVAYSHSELVLTKDPAGTPVVPAVDSFKFGIKNKVNQYIGNSATPQKLIKQGWVEMAGTLRGEPSDELMGMVRDARSNTAPATGFNRMTAVYTLSSKALTFDMAQMKPMLKEPGVNGEVVDRVDFPFEAFYDGTNTPLTVTVQF